MTDEQIRMAMVLTPAFSDDGDYAHWIRMGRAVLAAAARLEQTGAIPAGFALAPVEPTPEMVKAGGHVNSEWLNDGAPIGETRYCLPMPNVYRAMLAAAPVAQPAPALTVGQIEAAAKALAEVMDYPWRQMPDKGRKAMRENARRVLAAAGIPVANVGAAP